MPIRPARPVRPTPRTPAQRKQVEQARDKRAVAELRAKYAKQGKTPTEAEERQAIADAKRRRDAEAARKRLADEDEINGVPANRRFR
jgi:molybdopterin converting factor small subunit